ncbi:MAG TPA: DUF362 domain-containing protein [Candidatus Brocadiia bacterium]|nr:DUF362 domain-containing protein [Candidatus Brocadiales bacterium]
MRLTRRDFLGQLVAAGFSLRMIYDTQPKGCGYQSPTVGLFGCATTQTNENEILPLKLIQGQNDTRCQFVHATHEIQNGTVSIVRFDEPVKAIEMAVEMIDGLSFIKPGNTVLIKPAVNSEVPFPAATDPLMLSTIITMVRERDAGTIIVAERSGVWRDTERCMKATGTYKAAVESKAEVIFLEKVEYVKVHPSLSPGWMFGYSLPKMLSKPAPEGFNQGIDHIISLPTVRTHNSADFTMSLKNNMGFIAQWDRNWMHTSLRLQERIAELGLTIKPSLIVLDGRKAFCTGGPNKGELKSPGVIIAGKNMVACDALGLAVLKYTGTTKKIQNTSVWEIPQIKRAIEIGIGSKGIEEIKYHGIDEIQELKHFL